MFFYRNKSTFDAVVSRPTINSWEKIFDVTLSRYITSGFINMSKLFDRMDRGKSLVMLVDRGLKPCVIYIINSFLKKRERKKWILHWAAKLEGPALLILFPRGVFMTTVWLHWKPLLSWPPSSKPALVMLKKSQIPMAACTIYCKQWTPLNADLNVSNTINLISNVATLYATTPTPTPTPTQTALAIKS